MILKGKYNSATIHAETIEPQVINQIKEFLNTDVSEGSTIHIMPDTHSGKGCVVGFTMTILDKLCPNLVGVDVGCTISCIKLPRETKVLPEVFLEACKKIPNGVGSNAGRPPKFVDEDSIGLDKLTFELNHSETVINSIGSLGSGNHFIELNEDKDTGDHYIVVHTGSRNLGQQVCGYHMRVAKTDHSRGDLSYLTGHNLDNYLHDMKICQNYALSNHKEIYSKLLETLGVRLCKTEVFTTMHNYIDFNDHILRKGAISCQEGKKVLIPFNMRDGSVIGVGKGNPDWNFSGPHGAGRILSRTQAKQLITLEDFKESMKGITGTVCQETIDEAPMVYKKADEIERLISETVEVTNHLKVLANFKGF
jgi:RNA-splicing ligase RtcB